MDPDRKSLEAFVDGELPPDEMRKIALLLESRPDLNQYVREQEQLRALLRDTFANPEAYPTSDRLAATIQSAPVSWRWRFGSVFGRRLSIRSVMPLGAALAAGLAVGVLIRPAAPFSTDGHGQLIATGGLAHALNTQLASTGYIGTGAHVGISFRNKAGHDCRTFSFGNSSAAACRQNGAWIISVLVKSAPENPGAAYQMAGSAMPDAVRRFVEKSISGAPFDAKAERSARRQHWSGRRRADGS